MSEPKITVWHDCYEDQWTGFIIPAAFAHPAKYSKRLIERIYDHLIAEGLLKRGDIVGDCFGGVATGGLVGAYRGLQWYGVELEPKFVGWAQQNIALHRSKLEYMGCPPPKIIQGDSRRFHEIISEVVGVVTSPPYSNISPEKSNSSIDFQKQYETYRASGGDMSFEGFVEVQKKHSGGYGKTDGQISALKDGGVDAVLTSPPFTQGYSGGGGINKNGYTARPDLGPDWVGKRSYQGQGGDRAEGNIETLKEGSVEAVITSPPYSDISAGAGGLNSKPAKHPGQQSGRSTTAASQDTDQKYGKSEGQISRLSGGSVEAVVTSPPWESNCEGVMKASKFKDPEAFAKAQSTKGSGCSVGAKLKSMKLDEERDTYGQTEGSIGNTQKETYWQAMKDVYASVFQAIKPGGVLACVVKDYVKEKQRVCLCDDTCKLLEHVGFTITERIHAMLVKETREADMFEGETVQKKERKSFFRRLHEKKPGAVKIDWEEVLIARKPL